jgi:hypothetical protein
MAVHAVAASARHCSSSCGGNSLKMLSRLSLKQVKLFPAAREFEGCAAQHQLEPH